MPRPIAVSVTASAPIFNREFRGMAATSRQTATSIQGDAIRMGRSMAGAETAAKQLAKAERQVADAAGVVRVAESKALNVREKSRKAAEDLRTAEQRLQAVKARAGSSAKDVAQAEQDLAAARERSGRASTKALQNSEELSRATRRLAAAEREVASVQATSGGRGFLDSLTAQSGDIDRLGGRLLKVGASAGAGLALAGKAAMDWQSQWAGVAKTVDGSAAELSQLEGQLRGMARTMPTTHKDIAAVAEAAGQLGVKTGDIASFTKVMVQLGDTTNLSADEAATSLAQFMNVMGTAGADVGRLGATVVDLGNKGASTEKDIVEMAQRIAGAGKQVGLTETDVLGFANALSSVGINAEAGGTAISTSFLKIEGAVRSGGQQLDILAHTAGMTSSEFKQAFQTDAAGAVTAFLTGLDKVQRSGGDTTSVLRGLSITGIRESDALRRLASSGDLLSQSLQNGKTAWRDNNALVNEAAKRYATAESQARIAWNQIKDAGISAGTSLLPIIAQIATGVGKVAEFFADLPEPVRVAGAALFATVAIMGLVGGAGLKAVPGLLALRGAYTAAGGAATFAGRAMKIATLSIPVVGAVIFGVTTAMQLFAKKTTDAAVQSNTFSDAMQSVEGSVTRATAAMNENVRMAAVQALQQAGALDQARQLGLSLGLVTDAALGNKDAQAEVNRVLSENLALNPQVSKGNSDLRNAASGLAQTMGGVARESIAATAAENDRRAAMKTGTAATDAAKEASKKMGAAQDELAKKEKQLNAEVQKSIDKFTILRDGALGVERANSAWQASVDAVKTSVKQNGRTLDIHSGKGRANRDVVVGMITALNDKITADFKSDQKTRGLAKATDIASVALREGRKKIDDSARAAGLNTTEVKRMQDRMLKTPKKLQTDVIAKDIKTVQGQIDDLKRKIRELQGKNITVTASMKLKAEKAVFSKLGVRVAGVNSAGGLVRADGGPIPARDAGGPIRGIGGPRQDNIVGVDRDTGQQTAWVSNREFVTNARSYEANRDAVEQINAGRGRKFEVRPLADGGTVTRKINVRGAVNNPAIGDDLVRSVNSSTAAVRAGAAATAVALAKAFAREINASASTGNYSAARAGRYGNERFNREQLRNAATIASVGSSMGRRAVQIGLMTAMVESGLRNLSGGDRDSVGLFQQRAPWGSFAARHNPRTSAGMFFHGGRGGQPGLDDIRGWQAMSMGQAAQRVQVSAFPGRYQTKANEAAAIIAAMSIGGGSGAGGKVRGGRAWPTTGRITSTYAGHDGVDINARGNDHGNPIFAYRSGRITFAGYGHGYGNAVFEQPDVGPSVVYGHGSRVLVHNGQRVSVGQKIAEVGSTGNSTGDHLHFGHPGGTYAQAIGLLRGLADGGRPLLRDQGGWLPTGRSLVQNNTGKPELVLNNQQIRALAGGGAVGRAAGGPAPVSSFGTSTRYSVPQIVALIRVLERPLQDLADLTTAVRKEQTRLAASSKTLRRPKAALDAAERRYDRQTKRRQDLREEVADLKKRADATKGATRADREYKKAVADLRDLNNDVARSSTAKRKAQEAYDKAAAKAKVSSDKLKEAQQALAEQQKAVADGARQLAATFRGEYASKSTDANDWIQLMKDGTADIGAFTAKIRALRKAGLSETLVQQIIGMGAIAGTDVATQIGKGGKDMVASLNKANQKLQDAADKLGYTGVTGQGRFAAGGPIQGPGTGTSDSISIRASRGEWIVPQRAASVPANRRVLEDMTYGRRRVVERNYAQSYRYGGPVYATPAVQQPVQDNSQHITIEGDVIDPERMLRVAARRRRDAMARRGATRHV